LAYCVGQLRKRLFLGGGRNVKISIWVVFGGSFFDPFCKVRGLTAKFSSKNTPQKKGHFYPRGAKNGVVTRILGPKMPDFGHL
jgi:hypothetical protein